MPLRTNILKSHYTAVCRGRTNLNTLTSKIWTTDYFFKKTHPRQNAFSQKKEPSYCITPAINVIFLVMQTEKNFKQEKKSKIYSVL